MSFDDVKETKFNVGLMCGDCLHFKGSAHPKYEAACAKRGVGTKVEAPMCYTPDVAVFRTLSKDVFPMLSALVGSMSHKQSRVLMGLLKYAGTLEKAGLTFLEECYFCSAPLAEAYLEDFTRGYALTMTKSGQVVLVGSDYLKASSASMVAYLDKASVLNDAAFQKCKDRCMESGRVYRPRRPKVVMSTLDYNVPTIDDEPVAATRGTTRKRGSTVIQNTGNGKGKGADTKFIIES